MERQLEPPLSETIDFSQYRAIQNRIAAVRGEVSGEEE
jgi:hypothetical protein